jgi:hypothetical protein
MSMTTLYDLREEDWTDDARKGIEDWLMEPRALILCIYFRGNTLKAASDIPLFPVYDLTYFIRTPDQIFKVETFHDEIVFGTFVDSVESNMIQTLEYVYAPYFFAITTWPDSKYLRNYVKLRSETIYLNLIFIKTYHLLHTGCVRKSTVVAPTLIVKIIKDLFSHTF